MSESITIAAITACSIIASALIASPVLSAERKKLEKENIQLNKKILALENEVVNLKNKLKNPIELHPKDGILYDNDGNAYCPVCNGNGKNILLQKEEYEGDKYLNCKNCNREF